MSRRRQRAAKRRAREEAANLTSAPVAPMGGTVDARKAVAAPERPPEQSLAPAARSDVLMPPRAVRPTPEQIAKVRYSLPTGPGRHERPAVNLHSDIIAQLMQHPPLLLPDQHDAARDWQALRHEVYAEMGGPSQGRSCLDIGVAGYDAGEGDAKLAAHWRFVRASLGPERVKVLDRACVEGQWPRNIDALRSALDAFAVLHDRG